MKQFILVILLVLCIPLLATGVSVQRAEQLALSKLSSLYPDHQLGQSEILYQDNMAIAYVYHLIPSGYMVISAQDELPPLLAYSGTSSFHGEDGDDLLSELVSCDLAQRLTKPQERELNKLAWQASSKQTRFQQWPPAGYSTTEGWLKTNWTQSAPYNWMVPLDPLNQTRSVAGCPAVAMGQIVNFHQALNGTRFTDADYYHHNYGGRDYWIDNDYATLGFPSFPTLNGYLDELNNRYKYQQDISDSLKAALIFACGTACTQVYASNGSGTFGVNQAYAAYQRFNFPAVDLLPDTDPDLYPRMEANVKNAQPVHLAVVTPAWDMGHNVVVDGYNTDNYYHLNFGWGGTYNGWYLLPSQIPYGLTVVEGAIVDIAPYMYAMSVPDTLSFEGPGTQELEIVNLSNTSITIENLLLHSDLNPQEWSWQPAQPLPAVIPVNGMLTIDLSFAPVPARESVLSGIRLILDQSVLEVPLRFSTSTSVQDAALPQPGSKLLISPNPFSAATKLQLLQAEPGEYRVSIYNLKGQVVRSFRHTIDARGDFACTWDGTDDSGNLCASGIYYIRVQSGARISTAKVLHLK